MIDLGGEPLNTIQNYDIDKQLYTDNKETLKQGDIVKATVCDIDDEKITLKMKNNTTIQMNAADMPVSMGQELTFTAFEKDDGKIALKIQGMNTQKKSEQPAPENNDYKAMLKKINVKVTEENLHAAKILTDNRLEVAVKSINDLKDIMKKIDRTVNNVDENKIKALSQSGLEIDKIDLNILSSFMVEASDAPVQDVPQKTDVEIGKIVEDYPTKENKPLRKEIITHLVSAGLPVNHKNIAALEAAYKKVQHVQDLEESTIVDLVKKEKPLTLENVYIEKYAGSKEPETPQLPDALIEKLAPEIKKLFQREDIEDTKENRDTATLLIKNQVPVTKENIEKIKFLKNIKDNTSPKDVLQDVAQNIKAGIPPTNVDLRESKDEPAVDVKVLAQKYEKTIKEIKDVTYETITRLARANVPITLDHLIEFAQEEVPSAPVVPADMPMENDDTKAEPADTVVQKPNRPIKNRPVQEDTPRPRTTKNNPNRNQPIAPETVSEASDQQTEQDVVPVASSQTAGDATQDAQFEETVKARRQLAEVQLKLTSEAASRLANKQIDINVMPLKQAVEELRKLESDLYEKNLKIMGAEPSAENIDKMQDLFSKMQTVAQTPNSAYTIVSDVINNNIDFSVEGMHKSAVNAKVFEDIEMFQTAPSQKYGDSFSKVDDQFSDLLASLDIEPTEANIKAAKILSRNEIDVTPENVLDAKIVDFKISEVFDRLHPIVAAKMIKEGLNPVDMHVDDVLEYTKQFENELGQTSRDKLSGYILDMDNKSAVAPEDREAIVAIYRMLSTIQKHGSASVGVTLKSDVDLTLGNLLEASKTFERTKKGQDMDFTVDDDFGLLKDIVVPKENIRNILNRVNEAAPRPAPTADPVADGESASEPVAEPVSKPVAEPVTDHAEEIAATTPTMNRTANGTTTDTKQQTIEPKQQTTNEPTQQTTNEPRQQVTTEPRAQATTEPRPQTTTEPRPQVTTEPRPQTTTEPRQQAITEPRLQATTEPRPQTTTEPRLQATTEPRQQTTNEPRQQTTTEPRQQATTEPRQQTTTEPRQQATTEPRQQATTEPRQQTTAEPRPQTTTEPRQQTTTEPRQQATTEPRPQATTEPSQQTTT